MSYAAIVFAHLKKDLRIEWRNRDALNGMIFFALLVVVVFSLAFDPTAYPTTARQISGGLLWVGLLFASMTALNSAWSRELRHGALDAQRLAPSPASALFLGKAVSNFLFVSVVELVLAPVFTLMYNLHPLGQTSLLALVLPLGTWGLVCNGTFFAALGIRARNREMLLPLILLPVSMPAILAMVESTTAILTGDFPPQLWIKVLTAYDILFTLACLLLFGQVLHAE